MSSLFHNRRRSRRQLVLASRQQDTGFPEPTLSMTYLREALEFGRPLNWVITGEQYESDTTIATRFRRRLRATFQRPDTIVDATVTEDRMQTLHADFHERVLRHDPSVVVVTCGLGDPRPRHRVREKQALTAILDAVHRAGAIPVVMPPPMFLSHSHDRRLSRWRQDVGHVARVMRTVLASPHGCRTPDEVTLRLFRTLGIHKLIERSTVRMFESTSEPTKKTGASAG